MVNAVKMSKVMKKNNNILRFTVHFNNKQKEEK